MEIPSSRGEKIVRFRSVKAESPLRPLIQAVGFHRAKGSDEREKSRRGKILDPAGDAVLHWNRVFLFTSLVALFVDPLYFYLPSVSSSRGGSSPCIKLDQSLNTSITLLRTMTDLFFLLHVAVKLRTAYVAPSSRIFGRGELINDPKKIARRYLRSDFVVDLAAALPLPQILIWIIIPAMRSSDEDQNSNTLVLIVLFQYIPRLYVIFPLSREIIKASGVVTKTAWGGAAYNLLLYMLASHVLGASWYLLSIERLTKCWKSTCRHERGDFQCHSRYLDCDGGGDEEARRRWAAATRVFSRCTAGGGGVVFQFGIFEGALTTGAVSETFLKKYLYCLWWGLQNLSSYGQNLSTSTFLGETAFAILIAIVGLVLFAHLIGNMQTYLQSTTVRLEEWRLKRRDTEEWMEHRKLPRDLRDRVRRFVQYTWVVNQGVDEEAILRSLPSDLRKDIKLHLCLDLVRRVPFFSQVDDQLLGAICERLVSLLRTKGTYIIREGDAVTEMVFVIRGSLESSTTGGGRTGFFNCITLRRGDFCGEELLVWALLPRSSPYLPLSTRTVRTLTEVEGFALRAEDLRFVANQFRRLHSKKLQQTFRFYSHHWRSWAACFIQAAWQRFKRRRLAKDLILRESHPPASISPLIGEVGGGRSHGIDASDIPTLMKPDEPDFSRHCED
ncbi:putative cyclic nucleotide-gated ion channel 14 [Wolffia australiana]